MSEEKRYNCRPHHFKWACICFGINPFYLQNTIQYCTNKNTTVYAVQNILANCTESKDSLKLKLKLYDINGNFIMGRLFFDQIVCYLLRKYI